VEDGRGGVEESFGADGQCRDDGIRSTGLQPQNPLHPQENRTISSGVEDAGGIGLAAEMDELTDRRDINVRGRREHKPTQTKVTFGSWR